MESLNAFELSSSSATLIDQDMEDGERQRAMRGISLASARPPQLPPAVWPARGAPRPELERPAGKEDSQQQQQQPAQPVPSRPAATPCVLGDDEAPAQEDREEMASFQQLCERQREWVLGLKVTLRRRRGLQSAEDSPPSPSTTPPPASAGSRPSDAGPLSPLRRAGTMRRVAAAAGPAPPDAPPDEASAVPFDQLEIEDAAECLESLSTRLEELEREVRRAVERYARLEVSELADLAVAVRRHADGLAESIARAKEREAQVRDGIDTLSHKVAKAKKTVRTAKDLHVGGGDRLQTNLERVRDERARAIGDLELVLGTRNALQTQLSRFDLLARHLEGNPRERSYALVIDEVSSPDFTAAFGEEYQAAAVRRAETVAGYSVAWARTSRKLGDVVRAREGVRASLANMVATYWR